MVHFYLKKILLLEESFKTLIEYMNDNGVLKDLPDENQLSLFDML